MGHANTNCLISSLSIGDKKVLCTILAPTTRKDNFFDIRNAENKLYYPITMPFVGVYSPDELGLESYEENAWITNLVNHFRTGVRKAKQDKFDALALLSCINDKRNDADGDRAKWFDIKKPNELCELTKTLDVAYIDYEIFRNLFNSDNQKENQEVLERVLNQVSINLQILKEDRRDNEELSWRMFKLQDGCHDLFLRFNENLLISLLKGKNKKGKERDSYVEPMVDWVCVSYWLFNLARPWIPSVWSHQDDSGNEKVVKLAKIIIKVSKDNK